MMFSLPRRSLAILLLVVILGVTWGHLPGAHAQTAEVLRITRVDSSRFPTLTVEFEAFDAEGRFLTDLKAEQISVLEDERPITPKSLTLLQPGAHLIMVMNYGPEWAVGYAGQSRFSYLRQHLLNWARAQENTRDTLSIITNSGLQWMRNEDAQRWVDWLESAQPDLRREVPNLYGLARAFDLASNPAQTDQRSAILFITAPLPAPLINSLGDYGQRARSQGIPIWVWLVANTRASTRLPQNYAALNQLATDSGGQFLLFSGPETLPDLETMLQPLRYRYQLTYSSPLNTTGEHSLALQIHRNDLALTSETRSFSLDVRPPNPIFLAPPGQITRAWEKDGHGNATLQPEIYTFRILVEFPDGHSRPLRASRLYVDDVLVDEHSSPPFDTLTWPLESIASSGRYWVSVEIEDSLGLTRRSLALPIDVIVHPPPPNPFQRAVQTLMSPQTLPLLGILIAVGMVSFVLRRWRRHPALQQRQSRRARGGDQPAAQNRAMTLIPSLKAADAWLVPLNPEDVPFAFFTQPFPGKTREISPLPLMPEETILGSDPNRAHVCIPAPALSPLHARLHRTAAGFWLVDAGSVAGTWVNGRPLPENGILLHNGDILHLGPIALRFEQKAPTPKPNPVIQPYQEPE